MSLALLSLIAAWGAEPPCYGLSHPNTLGSDHFWVEWADGAADAEKAQVVLDAAEHAREVFVTDLGWPFTEEPIAIEIIANGEGGTGGFAMTANCDGVPVPRIELTVGEWNEASVTSVTAHEVGHAAEYGYMGSYTDGVASWLWWMEGTATWLERFATGSEAEWGRSTRAYLANPWVALHQGPTAFLVPERSGHMYGTAYLARYLEEQGGPEAVRATWEWAAPQAGTGLFFPDAIEGIGLDFEPFWERFLAGMTVGDIEGGEHLIRRVEAVDVEDLPASGEPEEGLFPEGTGVTAVHFDAAAGGRGQALQIAFDGDDEVDWIVVLVRTNGDRVGDRVLEYVPLAIDDGEGTGWVSGFDGDAHGWLVASPITRVPGPWRLSWGASRIDDPGPMPETVSFRDSGEEPRACGCATTPTPPAGLLLLLPLLLRRRRGRRGSGRLSRKAVGRPVR